MRPRETVAPSIAAAARRPLLAPFPLGAALDARDATQAREVQLLLDGAREGLEVPLLGVAGDISGSKIQVLKDVF